MWPSFGKTVCHVVVVGITLIVCLFGLLSLLVPIYDFLCAWLSLTECWSSYLKNYLKPRMKVSSPEDLVCFCELPGAISS